MSTEAQAIASQPVGQHGRGLPEPSGVDARHLLWLGGAALLLLGGAIFGLGALYPREVPVETMPPPRTFPQPRVQTDETAELKQILERQRQALTGYRWANKEHTLVQIPVERAMQIIAQKGAHAYDPIAALSGALSSPEAGAERAVTPSSAPPGKQSNPPAPGAAAEHSP
jgi:hypothetical protein